jgi:pimeloyl-ACP methyl ester carboxylesterase
VRRLQPLTAAEVDTRGGPVDGGSLRERVAGAVICNSAASRLIAGSAWSTGVAALGALEERIGLRAMRRGVPAGGRTTDLTFLLTRALSMHADASPAHVAFVEQLLIDVPTDIKATLATTLGTLDLSAALRGLDVPTLVITGERDRLTPVAQSEGLVAALPDARLLVVDSVGHHAPLEAHVEVTGAIRSHAEAALRPRGGRRRSARRKAR